jgi:Holliday junction DNA helicase RuvA
LPNVIGRLTGRVAAQETDGAVVIDVGGVGYEVAVPVGTMGRVRPDEAGRVTLCIHTHVREDALTLFGFADEGERAAFRALLGVSNVGPKIAVAVLGALPAAELATAIARQDLAAMKGIPGVGRKIAERLLLELRDKLHHVLATVPGGGPSPAPARRGSEAEERLRSALTGMGFKPSEADHVLTSLGERVGSAPIDAVLREALALLAR